MENSAKFELKALAVRGSKATSDTGMYCKIKYGKKKFKTQKITKNENSDWKDFFVFTYEKGLDLIIDCWQKGDKKRLFRKRFLGRVIVSHSDISSLTVMRKWLQLQSKAKHINNKKNKSAKPMGQLFVSLSSVGNQSQENEKTPTVQQNFKTEEEEVEKDTEEGEIEIGKGSEDLFKKKAGAALKTIKVLERDMKVLQALFQSERKESKKEIEVLGKKIQNSLQNGVRKLRILGLELNNTLIERELKQRMSHNNYLNGRFIKIVDEFTALQSEYGLGEIQTTDNILVNAVKGDSLSFL